jgi:hypothetical protein
MIYEVDYWERELERVAADLERRKDQRSWRRSSYAALEKLVMVGFYSVRKLIESNWVHHRLKKEKVSLTAYPLLKNTLLHWMFWPEIDEHFDLGSPLKRKQPLEFVYNQIIHSFVFTPAFRARRLSGVYFCSYDRRDHVYHADISELVRVLRKTAKARPGAIFRFGPEQNRFDERPAKNGARAANTGDAADT